MYTYNDSIVSLTNQNRINQGIDVNNGVYQQHMLMLYRILKVSLFFFPSKIYHRSTVEEENLSIKSKI